MPHIGMQWKFRDLLLPLGISLHDGVINLLRLVMLELHVERAMRLGIPCEDHHAAGDLVQPMDDEDLVVFFFQHFNKIFRIFFPAIGQYGQSCWFVEDDYVVVYVNDVHRMDCSIRPLANVFFSHGFHKFARIFK